MASNFMRPGYDLPSETYGNNGCSLSSPHGPSDRVIHRLPLPHDGPRDGTSRCTHLMLQSYSPTLFFHTTLANYEIDFKIGNKHTYTIDNDCSIVQSCSDLADGGKELEYGSNLPGLASAQECSEYFAT